MSWKKISTKSSFGTVARHGPFVFRVLHYERGPEGKKLDLLFIPFIRSEK